MRLRDLSQMPGFVNTFTETGANIFMVLQRLRLCWKEVLSCGDLLGFPCSQDGEQVEQKEACYTVCGPGVAEVLEKLYESLFLLSNV